MVRRTDREGVCLLSRGDVEPEQLGGIGVDRPDHIVGHNGGAGIERRRLPDHREIRPARLHIEDSIQARDKHRVTDVGRRAVRPVADARVRDLTADPSEVGTRQQIPDAGLADLEDVPVRQHGRRDGAQVRVLRVELGPVGGREVPNRTQRRGELDDTVPEVECRSRVSVPGGNVQAAVRGRSGAGRSPDPAFPMRRDLVGDQWACAGDRRTHHPPMVVSAVSVQAPVHHVHIPVRERQRAALLLDHWVRSRRVHHDL